MLWNVQLAIENQTNAIGAIHENNLFAVGLFDNTINSDVFHSWVKNMLIVTLPKNSVIVMDNATFHMSEEITSVWGKAVPCYFLVQGSYKEKTQGVAIRLY